MNWDMFIPVGIFVITLIGLQLNQSAKYLSIREHETYNSFVVREMDNINRRIALLEQTRPTTGELEAKLGNPQITKKECYTGSSGRS